MPERVTLARTLLRYARDSFFPRTPSARNSCSFIRAYTHKSLEHIPPAHFVCILDHHVVYTSDQHASRTFDFRLRLTTLLSQVEHVELDGDSHAVVYHVVVNAAHNIYRRSGERQVGKKRVIGVLTLAIS